MHVQWTCVPVYMCSQTRALDVHFLCVPFVNKEKCCKWTWQRPLWSHWHSMEIDIFWAMGKMGDPSRTQANDLSTGIEKCAPAMSMHCGSIRLSFCAIFGTMAQCWALLLLVVFSFRLSGLAFNSHARIDHICTMWIEIGQPPSKVLQQDEQDKSTISIGLGLVCL